MYIDKQLQKAVDYKFLKDDKGRPKAQVAYRGLPVAMLSMPAYEDNVEACQRHIYATVRSYIRMMDPSKG